MAYYYVTRVRYAGPDRVARVMTRENLASPQSTAKSRRAVLRDVGAYSRTVRTAVQRGRRWREGPELHAVSVDGERFLRIDRRPVPADDLGNLPAF